MNKISSELPEIYSIEKTYPLSSSDESIINEAIEILNKRMKRGDILCSPVQTRNYLMLQLHEEVTEVFCVLWLDNRNRVIYFQRMFSGTIDGASVYPREVVRHAIANNAAACILVHNHPSGVAEPSIADEQITKILKEALSLISVRVLDHMIVGDEVVSFAERGLL